MSLWLAVIVAVVAIGIIVVVVIAGTKAGQAQGFSGMGGDTIVRCSEGHLFTTLWVPGASLKAVRLGGRRYQRCPLCKKWRVVTPVPDAELSDEDRRIAAEHHDARLP